MAVILAFLDEPHLLCGSAEWPEAVRQLDSSRDLLCVLLGTVASAGGPLQLLREFARWGEFVPVLLLGETLPGDWPEEIRRHVLGSLEMPPSYNKLLDFLHRAQIHHEISERARERGMWREPNLFRSLVGTSRVIQRVRQQMQQVSDSDACVLLLGESGTGKEVVARNLHYHSRRRESPFVPVNCRAIPGELLESELCGHEKGAFSGALSSHAGRFELADGGTLFLDEIEAMSLPMQARLLRVLQEGTVERLGSKQAQSIDVRIIAATQLSLEQLMDKGRFREDLFHRLSMVTIGMPPLRDRVEDIPLLLNELISRMEHEKRGSIRFNSAALMSLCRHDWRGNLRELANLVERMAIMHPYGMIGLSELPKIYRHIDGEDEQSPDPLRERLVERAAFSVGLADPPAHAVLPPEGLDLKEYLGTLERSLIQQALDESCGVVARAAERLRIRRTTLVEKMRKYGMGRREDEDELSG